MEQLEEQLKLALKRIEYLEGRLAEMEKGNLCYTVKEAAQVTGLSESTIYWMVYRGEIPHRRVNARGKRGQGKILIPRTALVSWLEGSEAS